MGLDFNPDFKPKFTPSQRAIIIVGVTVLAMMGYTRDGPYTHPHFSADPYIAPQGCAVRSYELFDEIAESCADGRYLFAAWRKYGLRSPGKGGTYYRVGNDLIGINCNYGKCSVRGTEPKVF